MTLKEAQGVLYEILVDIHEFCVENNIKYSLGGGSLLGAIRHNGFIPWDDDIDIQMSRPDYEIFIHSYCSKRGYKLFSRELPDNEDVGIAFARVCEMERTYVDTGVGPWKKNPTGLWVDILPIDGAPSDERIARRKIRRMYLYWRILIITRARLPISFSSARGFTMKVRLLVKKCFSWIFPSNYALNYIKKCQEYDYCKSTYIANYTTMQNKFREWQPKYSMESFVLHKFEKGEFYIMENYSVSLSHLYGDYMKLPPVEKQIAHEINSFYWI